MCIRDRINADVEHQRIREYWELVLVFASSYNGFSPCFGLVISVNGATHWRMFDVRTRCSVWKLLGVQCFGESQTLPNNIIIRYRQIGEFVDAELSVDSPVFEIFQYDHFFSLLSMFYRLFEEKVGIGLPLTEEFSMGSQLSLRFGVLWFRKYYFRNFI